MMSSYQFPGRRIQVVRATIPLLVSLVLPITAFGQGGNFSAGVNYPVPGQGGIAAGDFNGDKVPDIVIANQDSTVSILIGIPGGTFQPQYTVQAVPSTGTYSTYMAESVAVGDFNGDGNLDLAVLSVSTDSSQGTVNILLGDGTGHFAPPTAIPLDGTQPLQIVSADFNNDSKTDLAVLNLGSMSATILLGKGNGTFTVLADTPFGSQPAPGTNGNMAVADLNKDGKLDLAIAGTSPSNGDGVVSVLLGNGDGTFQPAANWIVTSTGGCTESCAPPTTVAVGDFNGDGNLDLAVDDGVVGGLFVLLGKGDGSFQTPPIHSGGAAGGGVGSNPRVFLVTGDFNGDGKLDLAEAEGGVYPSFPDLTIALGNGDGTFAAGLQMSVGTALSFSSATAIITDDLNADGFPDLILATNTGYAIGLGFNAATVVLNCGLRCTNTAVASSPASSVFNQTVTFTATVTAANAKATETPTGTVVFQNTSTSPVTTLGSAPLSGGQATFPYSGLSIGQSTIVANYQGDSNFDSSTSSATSPLPLIQTVTMAPTTTALSSSPDPSNPSQSVTFTATVTPSTSGVPTGTVTFSDNGNPLVSQPLNSTASATFTTSSLSTGTHSVTGTYSGDSNFTSSMSPALTQIVGSGAAPFTVSSSPTNATVTAGGSTMFAITVATVPSVNSAISLSCTGLPAGANCSFSPAQITPKGATATASLTITTTGSGSVMRPFLDLPKQPKPVPFAAFGFLALAILLAVSKQRSQRAAMAAFVLLCVSVILTGPIACGGGNTPTPTRQNVTPKGTAQINVVASSNGSTQSTMIALTVN